MKSHHAFGITTAMGMLAILGGCAENESADSAPTAKQPAAVVADAPRVASSAAEVTPLKSGNAAPAVTLLRPDGRSVSLSSVYAAKPTVLIFYRGGWCPYCNAHLGQIGKAEPELIAMGYQVVAVSPDRPEELQRSVDKQHLTYQLLSDSDMTLAKAFGLAFKVDDVTVTKYRGFGIDLDRASGQSHHLLPVPAVYIVDRTGQIRFAHWNPDYKSRLEPKELVDAARGAITN